MVQQRRAIADNVPDEPFVVDAHRRLGRLIVVADGKEHALAAYITEHDPEFLPALTTEAAKPAGTQFVRQSAGSDAPAANAGQAYLNKTYKQGAS